MLEVLNSAPMYLICGLIILFVALVCVVFMVRAYKAGIAIGMAVQTAAGQTDAFHLGTGRSDAEDNDCLYDGIRF